MPGVAWLLLAVLAGVGAYVVGWPAWRQVRSRETRDLNVERYRAWRGHSRPSDPPRPREGMTADERRRLIVAAILALAALGALVAFFATT